MPLAWHAACESFRGTLVSFGLNKNGTQPNRLLQVVNNNLTDETVLGST